MQAGGRLMKKESGIKTWSRHDQPREKLLEKGPQALTDSELLAILIRIGNPQSNAIELAREILKTVQNNLHELGKRPLREIMKTKGIGEAKAMTIAAALELGRRRQSSMSLEKPAVKDSREVAGYLRPKLADYQLRGFRSALPQPGRPDQSFRGHEPGRHHRHSRRSTPDLQKSPGDRSRQHHRLPQPPFR